jgi:hypothetical protein
VIRCWNCGNDLESDEDSIRRDERDRILTRLEGDATLLMTVGDMYGADALRAFANYYRAV